MSNEHPITPPPELVQQWYDAARGPRCEKELATQAARWGADRELQACCKVLDEEIGAELYKVGGGNFLRAARRPKPPSQAEQALEQFDLIESRLREQGVIPAGCIRTALERLKELE